MQTAHRFTQLVLLWTSPHQPLNQGALLTRFNQLHGFLRMSTVKAICFSGKCRQQVRSTRKQKLAASGALGRDASMMEKSGRFPIIFLLLDRAYAVLPQTETAGDSPL
jgi:hypothetical protein